MSNIINISDWTNTKPGPFVAESALIEMGLLLDKLKTMPVLDLLCVWLADETGKDQSIYDALKRLEDEISNLRWEIFAQEVTARNRKEMEKYV